MSNLVVKLQLNSLKNVFVKDFKGKTETKKCLCIPIDDNDLFISEQGGAYLNLIAWANDKLKDSKTHLIKQSFSKARRAQMTDEELKSLVIIGDIKPMESQQKTELTTPDPDPITEFDDLPF